MPATFPAGWTDDSHPQAALPTCVSDALTLKTLRSHVGCVVFLGLGEFFFP